MKRAADVCTGLRVALAPVLAWSFAFPRAHATGLPFLVYLVAAASDYLDGILARATGTASRGGRVFDHCADALLLFPSFVVLAHRGSFPAALPLAALTAFTLYVVDGWRRGGGLGAIELTGSRSGALGGILNYGIAGAAAAALGLAAPGVDRAIYLAAFPIAAVNAVAAYERLALLLTSTRGSLAEERAARASRSSP